MSSYSKYRAKKCKGYDSKKEYRRAQELKAMQEAGLITDLQEQVPYELIPTQWTEIPRVGKKGQQLKPIKKCLERSCTYIADFVYTDSDGKRIVEDTKSKATRTPEYIIKRKLMLWTYGIKISEV